MSAIVEAAEVALPPEFGTTEPDEFLQASIDWSLRHLGDANAHLASGDRARFITSVRMFRSCANALVATLPSVVSEPSEPR